MTLDSFKTWKVKFDHDMAIIKAKEEEEKMKGMSAKEKDEYRRIGTRLSGKITPASNFWDLNTLSQDANCSNAT